MLEINNDIFKRIERSFPNKKIKDHIYHIRQYNRWIQISTPIKDENIHYEFIGGKIELHFEGDLDPYQDMIEYLIFKTKDIEDLEWGYWDIGYRFVNKQYVESDNLEPILQDFVALFDGLITEYNKIDKENSLIDKLGVTDKILHTQGSTVGLHLLSLKEVLELPLAIPDYQRIYCWEEQDVICLLEDVINFVKDNTDKKYRLGTLILHYYNDSKDDKWKYAIIDGQQRLITLAMLLFELKKSARLMKESIASNQSQQYIAYNKHLISTFCKKRQIDNKKEVSNAILSRIEFSVLVLENSSLDLAYTFFSNQNSRGVALSDYDLLKAHHLRFIPQAYEEQATNAAETWNKMIEDGRSEREKNEVVAYERTLDTYIYRLRRWMRKKDCDDDEMKYRVKQEFEASPIIDGIPPFGERFYFNEPIQGGTHFFEYVKQHLGKYRLFSLTTEYVELHSRMAGGSFQYYRDVIEGILFAYYLKFGDNYLADALAVIMRRILQHRYTSDRALKASVIREARDSDFVLMIDQATSPTFFLAEARNEVKDMSYSLKEMTPIKRRMLSIAQQIAKNIELSVETFKEFNI